jgi:hypothetical protein
MRPSTGRRRGGGASQARSTRSRPWWCGRSVAWHVTSGMANTPHTQRPRRRLAFASSAIRTCAWSGEAVTSRSQAAVEARSSTERVVTIIRNRGSLLVLCIVWPLPCAQLISGAEPAVPLTPGSIQASTLPSAMGTTMTRC